MKFSTFFSVLSAGILSAGFSYAQNDSDNKVSKFDGWDYELVEQPTVIKGKFIGVDPDSLDLEYGRMVYNHLIEGEQIVDLFEVSDSGSFQIIFPLMRPQEIMITLPYHFGYLYACPGKTTSFIFDVAQSKSDFEQNKAEKNIRPAPIVFDGDLAEFNNHFNQLIPLVRRQFFWPDNKLLLDSLDQADYKTARLEGMQKQFKAAEDYLKTQNCGENISLYIRTKIRYMAYNDLMRYRWLKNLNTDRSRIVLTESYRDFLNEEHLNDPNALLTEDYSSLMHELNMEAYSLVEINYNEVVDLLNEAGVMEQEDKEKLLRLNSMDEEGDSIDPDSLLRLKVNLIRKYELFAEFQKRRTYEAKLENIRNMIPGLARDIVASRSFMGIIGRNTALTTEELKDVEALIGNADLVNYIHQANERLTSLDEENMPENVQIIADLLPIGEQVLNKLVNPYRGRIVYIDFWAPWCGPCISEMRRSGDLKKQLKEKDVVFLYLGVNCEKEAWERAIKKYDIIGEHYLTDDREYNLLSAEFNISGIPRYMLIDQDGKIVDDNAPRPSQSMELVRKIEELEK